MMAVWGAVIVAAGKGRRMGTKESKQYLLIEGKPILVHTLERFSRLAQLRHLVIVVGQDDVSRVEQLAQQHLGHRADISVQVISGGDERQASVYKGLLALPQVTDYVLVHDGVRPYTKREHIEACMEQAERTGAAVLAVPVKDTIKVVSDELIVETTPKRETLWAIQTPQAFRLEHLLEAHRQAESVSFTGTDDAMLIERIGRAVHVVLGDETNIKITTPDDLVWAEWLSAKEKEEQA